MLLNKYNKILINLLSLKYKIDTRPPFNIWKYLIENKGSILYKVSINNNSYSIKTDELTLITSSVVEHTDESSNFLHCTTFFNSWPYDDWQTVRYDQINNKTECRPLFRDAILLTQFPDYIEFKNLVELKDSIEQHLRLLFT